MTTIFSSRPLAEYSLAELNKKENSTKLVGYVFGGLILVILAGVGIVWFKEGTYPGNLGYMGGFTVILYLIDDKLKKIKAEIASRQQ